MTRATADTMASYLTARQSVERRQRLVQAACLLAAVGLIAAAGLLVTPLNELRREHQLTLDPESVKGLPPDIQLLTKTGTLRALAVDLAFIRLERLKEENRFYELMQLSNWLCKLAPRYASVWSYSAWNMAYNISVAQFTPEARWMWVNNGIENLRSLGLRFNPKSVTLYKELAWIFYHKIGDKLDDFHWQYKSELGVEQERLLGEPPIMASTEQAIALIRDIVEAPDDPAAWLASTNGGAALQAALDEVALAADDSLLEFAARDLRTYTSVASLAQADDETGDFDRMVKARAIFEDAPHAPLARRLLASLRKQRLRERYNMDPAWMLELMEDPVWMRDREDISREERLVPIDWRLPYAHTLYWATKGDMVTRGQLNIDEADSMNTVRFIFFALKGMAEAGRLLLEPNFEKPNESFIQMMHDSRFFHHLHAAYLYFGPIQFGEMEGYVEGTSGRNYRSGHHNFLMQAMRLLYIEGQPEQIEEAKRYYAYLFKFDRTEDGQVKPAYHQPFEQFIFKTIFDAVETQANANALISVVLERAFKHLSEGDATGHVRQLRLAKRFWEYYMRDMKTDRNTRRKLQPLAIMRRDAAKVFFSKSGYSPLEKSRVWPKLERSLRQAVYDDVIAYVEEQCKRYAPPLDPRKVLPEPPGMDEYRADPDRVLKELNRYDDLIEQGEKQTPLG
jgi:hypothetical protein